MTERDAEIARIEAVLRKHIVNTRTGALTGIPEAAREIAALRSKDREDGARWMRERAKLVCLDYSEACLDRSVERLHQRDLPRTGDALGWADAATGCARLVAALPLSTEQTEAGDA